jgi:cytochrome P450
MDAVVYAIISERRKQNTDTGDLLSMLLLIEDADTGERMTDTQLRDEVLTMLVAGHETTATALTWAWGLLDQHPEVRSKLDAELAQVLGGRAPTMDDVPNLTYTRMIIDETMRLYPPVYIFSRHVVADDELNGYHIPKGASVDLSPYLTHRHPDFWEEPERFMPERFSAEQVAARHKYAYIPFSTGPRICIGNNFALLEMTLVLATVAQRYRPRLIAPTLPKALPLITLRPQDGMPMHLEVAEQAVLG